MSIISVKVKTKKTQTTKYNIEIVQHINIVRTRTLLSHWTGDPNSGSRQEIFIIHVKDSLKSIFTQSLFWLQT